MQQVCKQCQGTFEILPEDLAFYDKISPVFNGKKYLIPPPTLCPECRQKRRLSWYNLRQLYSRKCDLCQQEIVSIYSPDKPYTVYCYACWFSGSWEPSDYGQAFDSQQSFFQQYDKLLHHIPLMAMIQKEYSENSTYCNFVGAVHNCYLLFASGGHLSDILYSQEMRTNSSDCTDCFHCRECELCYECVSSEKCHNLKFSYHCRSCVDSYFLKNCTSCRNCFGCVGLQHKEYCFFNEQLSKEAYQQKMLTIQKDIGSISKLHEMEKQVNDFFLQRPNPCNSNLNNEGVSGDYISNSKDCYDSFDVQGCTNCRYSTDITLSRDCYDLDFYGGNSELIYECNGVGSKSYGIYFSFFCTNSCLNLFYCNTCFGCKNCFGCYGLRNKEYCILNKQYTKEEYEKLIPQIIEHMQRFGEWGEFFPGSLSPFGYNETVAQEYFSLTREQVLGNQSVGAIHELPYGTGFNWSDYVPPKPDVKKIIPASKLPDTIKDIPDDILNWAIECEVTGKPFRIIKQELKFYREHNLPIPRRHPDQRHKDRMALRNPRKLWTRQCDCAKAQHQHERAGTTLELSLPGNGTNRCPQQFQTTYSPDRPETVYCEQCYLKEVY